MSDEEQKDKPQAAKKKPVVLFAVIGVVLFAAAGGTYFFAGSALGLTADEAAEPKAGKKKKKPAKKPQEAPPEAAEGEELPEEDEATAGLPSKIARVNSLVIDIRDTEGGMHHLKLNIAIEHPEGKEDEFVTFEPRAREALISYLRVQTFEEVMNPKTFDALVTEIKKRVRTAFGEYPVRRILITDFVAQ